MLEADMVHWAKHGFGPWVYRVGDGEPAARGGLMELSAIRAGGLLAAALIIGFAVWRRRTLRNVDVLLLLALGLGLGIVSATSLPDSILSFFSFRKGGGGRILGLAVFAIVI